MQHFGTKINLVVCGIIVVLNLVVLFQANIECRKRAQSRWWSAYRLILILWVGSWVCWAALYLLIALAQGNHWDKVPVDIVLHCLSDCNSVFLLLIAYGLAKGSRVYVSDLTVGGIIVTVAFLVFDIAMVALAKILFASTEANVILYSSSVGLSMLSMVALGMAFRLRYGTYSVWILCVLYALSQPFAYGALFASPHNSGTTCIVTLARELEIPTHLVPFVEKSPRTDGTIQYTFKSNGENRRLLPQEENELLQILWGSVSVLKYGRVYVEMRYDELVFVLVAFLKLALSITVVAQFCREPSGHAPSVTVFSSLRPPRTLIPGLGVYRIVHGVVALAGLFFCWAVFGGDIVVGAITFMIPVVNLLLKFRGGRRPMERENEVASAIERSDEGLGGLIVELGMRRIAGDTGGAIAEKIAELIREDSDVSIRRVTEALHDDKDSEAIGLVFMHSIKLALRSVDEQKSARGGDSNSLRIEKEISDSGHEVWRVKGINRTGQ